MVLKYNNFHFFILIIILLSGVSSRAQGLVLDDMLQKKINKVLKKEYPLQNDIDYQLIKKENNRIIYEIINNQEDIGYFALCRAKSMYDVFDYAIFFNSQTRIKTIKIFRYNEDYGYEIAAKWFLKQFFEKQGGNDMYYGNDIDGISGATISAKSVTSDIKTVSEMVSLIGVEKYLEKQE